MPIKGSGELQKKADELKRPRKTPSQLAESWGVVEKFVLRQIVSGKLRAYYADGQTWVDDRDAERFLDFAKGWWSL